MIVIYHCFSVDMIYASILTGLLHAQRLFILDLIYYIYIVAKANRDDHD